MNSSFQAFVVRGVSGPVVTLQAGVDFAGYYWTTTSRKSGKVKALRRDPVASVLSRGDLSWVHRTGRAIVLDPAHPSESVRELPAAALAGTALALIAARYPQQLLGYLLDGASTPTAWRPHNRVLLAVRHEGELAWPEEIRRFPCWLGLDSAGGPVVVPAEWKSASSTVRVPAVTLMATDAYLPGRVCVTIDDSDSTRPSSKTGTIARGEASKPRVRNGMASLAVHVDFTSTWHGFRTAPTAA